MAQSDTPKTKTMNLRFRGADIDEAERLLDNIGKAIGQQGEADVIILCALRFYAGTLGVR